MLLAGLGVNPSYFLSRCTKQFDWKGFSKFYEKHKIKGFYSTDPFNTKNGSFKKTFLSESH